MPIYEYECTDCGKTVEEIQAVADPPLTQCPACNNNSLRKLLSAPAFQFKGSGWYVTDYADRGKTSSGSEDSSTEKKADSSESTTSSTKETSSKSDSAAKSSD